MKYAITDLFVLPKDVEFIRVSELPAETRKQFTSETGDYALTRPGLRCRSKIVTPDVVNLLREFHEPYTITAAVIRFCTAQQLAPEETLEQVFPVLRNLIDAHILVPHGSDHANRIAPSFAPGSKITGLEVLECIQSLEDTEVYQVRTGDGMPAALKISRQGGSSSAARALEREARMLRRLDGEVSPRLLRTGSSADRRYLVTEWCDGVPAEVAARELRRDSPEMRSQLLRLCGAIAQAYAHVHRQGVVHGDVHPTNVLVDRRGRVRIVDFGLARTALEDCSVSRPPRGGVDYYMEPEFAAARLEDHTPPPVTESSEQYSLAAMLYFLITGVEYLDFSAEKTEMRRQIVSESPLPFAPRARSWPPVEKTLFKALGKNPAERFSSVSEFADQLFTIPSPEGVRDAPARASGSYQREVDVLTNDVVHALAPGSQLFQHGITTAPTASVNFGSAGIAYALYRISGSRDDASLLSLADIWASRAAAAVEHHEAFYDDTPDFSPESVGRIALYHTASGVYAVQALIGHAMGDTMSTQVAIDEFVQVSTQECRNLDVTLGKSGTLIGCATLLNSVSHILSLDREGLLKLGDDTMADIWKKLEPMEPVELPNPIDYLGIAHGWAGILYATLLWCRTAGRNPPADLMRRLQELAQCGEPKGRGMHWKIRVNDRSGHWDKYMPGWCNGSAGQTFLWTQAYQQFGYEQFLELAEKSAWNCWEESYNIENLCCGISGAAYALENFHKLTGEHQWCGKAQDMAARALDMARSAPFSPSLYKGTAGVALTAASLLQPHTAVMPMFEPEYVLA
ncbi:protein kinase [Streptomyces sp. NBC_01310]|uniref:lanthionine synthetase LanC family protein n=1 Tax=Streptomyces sp. NBC_01310 TaxID=2903820 RepID=UPI0035B65A8B|nr:protein kinase [Streptomyces sp. NBC_01310]